MIKYDYSLIRDFKDHKDQFYPLPELTNLPNCVYVKGPNAIGKSTLLNIIALGFHGHRMNDDEMAKQLRARLEDLLDTNQQQLTFSIEISNEITNDLIVIEKNNPENKEIQAYRYENNIKKPVSSDLLNAEYKLIYDIPIDPLVRLPTLLTDFRSSQNEVGKRITNFRYYLQDILKIGRASCRERV